MKAQFFTRRALPVLMAVFFLVPFGLRGARLSLERMKNDMKEWLPSTFMETAQLDWFRDNFLGEQFILCTWDGCEQGQLDGEETGDPNQRLEMLAKKLVREDVPDVSTSLGLYTVDSEYLNWAEQDEKWLKGDNGHWFYVTPDGRLFWWEGGLTILTRARSLLHRMSGDKDPRGKLLASLDPRYYVNLQQLATPFFQSVRTGPEILDDLASPGGALLRDEDAAPDEIAEARAIAMERLKGSLFGPEGRQTCMIITLTEAGKTDLRRSIGRGMIGKPLGQLYVLAAEAGVPMEDVKLGGPLVDNVSIDAEGQITLVRLIGLCIVVGFVLSYLCFRSVEATLMVFFVGGISAIASLAIVYWSGGSVDAVLMSMPPVVYVLGLSGAIHIINYYRDAVQENGLHGASERALSLGWRPCALAAFTTSIGLLSLCLSDIVPIQKFGLYTALGVMATLGMLFFYLPAALVIWPALRRKSRVNGDENSNGMGSNGTGSNGTGNDEPSWLGALLHRAGEGILRHNGIVSVVCLLVFIFGAFGVTRVQTSIEMLKMFHEDAEIIKDYTWIENHIGALVPMELVVRVTPDRIATHELPTGAPDDDEQDVDAEGSSVAAADAASAADENAADQEQLRLTFLDRMELAERVQRVIEDEFGEEGSNVVGSTMSAATFGPPLPRRKGRQRVAQQRNLTSKILLKHMDEFLDSDYLSIDPADQAELWRVSLRVGALKQVDYGEFVRDLKNAVEPVMSATRFREVVIEKVARQRDGLGLAGSKIYLLGVPYAAEDETGNGDAPDGVELAAASLGGEPTVHDVDQTQIFTRTLYDILHNAEATVAPDVPDHPDYDPQNLQKYLPAMDCVVLLQDHPAYDVDQIRANSKQFVDARDHVFLGSAFATGDVSFSTDSMKAVETVYTGVVPLVYKAQRTLLDNLIVSTGTAFLIIAVVMMIVLRGVRAGLLSMLPNAFPVIVIFGMLGMLQIKVDIGAMMTASVAMGVAVDDTIHFLTWFRAGLDKGLERRDAIRLAYERCGTAMFQTTCIGGLGLSIFVLSTFTPTRIFGYMMLFLLCAALVGDLVFLPALLAGPLGGVFKSRRPANDEPDPRDQDSREQDRLDAVESTETLHSNLRAETQSPDSIVRRDNAH